MASRKITEEIRNKYMGIVKEAYEAKGEEVLLVNTNEYAVPVVHDGSEYYIVVTFRIPTGSREGVAYDGHAMAEAFVEEQASKKEKAEMVAEAKKKKMAKDKARRAKEKEIKESE